MNQQRDRTLQQTTTSLGPAEVLTAAKRFFARRNSIYAAFPEKEGPTFVALRGQGGEEVIIGVAPARDGGGTQVTGSTYIFDQQVARFFATLPAPTSPDGAPPSGGAGQRAAPALAPMGVASGAPAAQEGSAGGATTPGATGAVPLPADAQSGAETGGATSVTKASVATGTV